MRGKDVFEEKGMMGTEGGELFSILISLKIKII